MERKWTNQIAPFGLRLQPELKQKIKDVAADNARSQNSEIIHRLELSFKAEESPLFLDRTNGVVA